MIRQSKSVVRRVINRALAPMSERIDATQRHMDELHRAHEQLSARIEQLSRANDRLVAHYDRFREEIAAEYGNLTEIAAGARSVVSSLVPDGDAEHAGNALIGRFDDLTESVGRARKLESNVNRSLAEVRSSMRLTQAMVDQVIATGGTAAPATGADAEEQTAAPRPVADATPPVPVVAFSHLVPSFDLLYRSFEDRHRGSIESIQERQEGDYLALLSELPNEELPIVDLGCGRGELVELLSAAGLAAIGVDANLGQLVGGGDAEFVQDDLFQWLDQQDDGTVRAITSLHVVEHVPLDLQIRLVFEARRVLADGGLLILETPNTLSLSVAASNFWVDPTHQRPVHPLFLELLAEEAGFSQVETRLLHDIGVSFRGANIAPDLVKDLNSLILGAGDMALVARR